MYILGIWDNVGSGVALLNDNRIVFAVNEEIYTKQKFEYKFPENSIKAALKYCNIKASDIDQIVFSGIDPFFTASRVMPNKMDNYYKFIMKSSDIPNHLSKKQFLYYKFQNLNPSFMCMNLTKGRIKGRLKHMNFNNFNLHFVNHQAAHAAYAAFTSPFNKCLSITLDDFGDGISASVYILDNLKFEKVGEIKKRNSIGLFLNEASNILGLNNFLGMGGLDELSNYSYPYSFDDNKLQSLFDSQGTGIFAKYNLKKQYTFLRDIAWKNSRERFAYDVQQEIEYVISKFISSCIDRYGIGDVALSGNLVSNMSLNRRIRNLENLKHWYIPPNSGDGGIALGEALYLNYEINSKTKYGFSPNLGQEYTEDAILDASKLYRLRIEKENIEDQAAHAAELINSGNYILWYQGRQDYDQKSLGSRSIFAPSKNIETLRRLNLDIKRNEWFRTFPVSILKDSVDDLVNYDNKGDAQYGNMDYLLKENHYDDLKAVSRIDKSSVVQTIDKNNNLVLLLKSIKKDSGYGAVLNTDLSFSNSTIVNDPSDAFYLMRMSNAKYMFINGFTVMRNSGNS